MRYVVLGAGAIGGTVGARLADAGRDVVLVARGEHAAAMRADGLRVATPERVITARCPVVDDPAQLDLGPDDVLLLATKSGASADLLDRVAAVDGGAGLPVFCLQNGVVNERIALRRFARVYGVVVMMPAVLLEPGRIDAQGAPYSGLLDLGRVPGGTDGTAAAVAADLRAAGFVSRAVPDVMRWKYAKLLRNVGNAVEALCGHELRPRPAGPCPGPLRPAAGRGGARPGRRRCRVDRRRGVAEPPRRAGGARRGGGPTAGGRVDLAEPGPPASTVEADYLNGEIVLLARLAGTAAPLNDAVRRLVNRAAAAGAGPGSIAPAELAAELAGALGAAESVRARS